MVRNILFTLLFALAMVGCNNDDEIEIPAPDLRKTFIPDDNFEQALIELGYDDILDDSVFTSNIENRYILDISNRKINDITGINDFVNMRYLNCAANPIEELNISNLIHLKELHCFHNHLSSLDVSELNNLIELSCHSNQISELDLSNNIRLVKLSVSYNYSLNELDLTENILLEQLGVQSTDLKFLNLSNNQYLRHLWCGGNKFSELDLSFNPELRKIWMPLSHVNILDLRNNINLSTLDCFKGNLEKIILGRGNMILWHLDAKDNPNLSCIQVDDEELANSGLYNPYKLWEFDEGFTFSEDCGY